MHNVRIFLLNEGSETCYCWNKIDITRKKGPGKAINNDVVFP